MKIAKLRRRSIETILAVAFNDAILLVLDMFGKFAMLFARRENMVMIDLFIAEF
jgi:hypothetical protein